MPSHQQKVLTVAEPRRNGTETENQMGPSPKNMPNQLYAMLHFLFKKKKSYFKTNLTKFKYLGTLNERKNTHKAVCHV